jgi:hypothetical protein
LREEVIYEGFDTGWDSPLPITLISYKSGKMDLHRQTGTQFMEHMRKAAKILARRNLFVDLDVEPDIRSSGAYYDVSRGA